MENIGFGHNSAEDYPIFPNIFYINAKSNAQWTSSVKNFELCKFQMKVGFAPKRYGRICFETIQLFQMFEIGLSRSFWPPAYLHCRYE